MDTAKTSEGKTYSPGALKKRARILETALKVFAREGFHNADVQIIADLAGVGKGTVYRHFGNKHELFLAAARTSVEWLAEYVHRAVQDFDGVADLLRGIARACAAYYQEHPEAVEVMIQERAEFRATVFPTVLMFRSTTATRLDGEIREAILSGEFRQVEPASAVNAYLDLLYGCAVCGCLGGDTNALVQRFEDEVAIFLEGLLRNSSHDERGAPRPAPTKRRKGSGQA